MIKVSENTSACKVCKDHKKSKPFKIRADNGIVFETSFISNCPYCGRFLKENYSYMTGNVKKNSAG